jgi:hypothetical protein
VRDGALYRDDSDSIQQKGAAAVDL